MGPHPHLPPPTERMNEECPHIYTWGQPHGGTQHTILNTSSHSPLPPPPAQFFRTNSDIGVPSAHSSQGLWLKPFSFPFQVLSVRSSQILHPNLSGWYLSPTLSIFIKIENEPSDIYPLYMFHKTPICCSLNSFQKSHIDMVLLVCRLPLSFHISSFKLYYMGS